MIVKFIYEGGEQRGEKNENGCIYTQLVNLYILELIFIYLYLFNLAFVY